MAIDPRNISSASPELTTSRLAELERRALNLERQTRTVAKAGVPAAPGTLTVYYDGGDTKVDYQGMFAGGTTVVDKTNNRTYYWTGTVWKYTAII